MNERGSESRETPLHFASLLGTAERLRSGELSPVSLTETMLDRLAAHGEHYPSRANEYGEYFREFLAVGASVTDAAYATASELRAAFNERFRTALAGVDAVAGPSGGVPFPADEAVQYGGMDGFGPLMEHIQLQFTAPSNFAGTPTVSLPCGTKDGVPLTLQLLGDRLTEPILCRIGNTYERATEWHTLVPSLIAGRS